MAETESTGLNALLGACVEGADEEKLDGVMDALNGVADAFDTLDEKLGALQGDTSEDDLADALVADESDDEETRKVKAAALSFVGVLNGITDSINAVSLKIMEATAEGLDAAKEQ